MWCTEQDISDDLRRPILAYRRRRLCHAVLGVVAVSLALLFLLEQAVRYINHTQEPAFFLLQTLLSVAIGVSGSAQLYRYWLWRKSL